jgi:hypothetical protein
VITLRWRGGEVDGHTFGYFIASHVNYGPGVTVTKAAMPGFNVRGPFSIKSSGRGCVLRTRVRDTSQATVQEIEIPSRAEGTPDDNPVIFVCNPAVAITKANKSVATAVKGGHKDEVNITGRDVKDIFQREFVARRDAKVDVADPKSIGRSAVETFDRVRCDGTEGLKVRLLRGDMMGSSRI